MSVKAQPFSKKHENSQWQSKMDFEGLKERVTLSQAATAFDIDWSTGKHRQVCFSCGSSSGLKVYSDRFYNCFRCGKKGDVFNMLVDAKKVENLSQSFRLINEQFGEGLSNATKYAFVRRQSTLDRVWEAYSLEAGRQWSVVEEYCFKRGWKKIQNVGYATGNLLSQGFTKKELEDADLFDYGKEYYDNHLVFPIYDRNGRLVHFNARALDSRDLRWKSTKGNYPVHRYFYNSAQLFNPTGNKLIICEGVSDAYSVKQFTEQFIAQFGVNVKLSSHYEQFAKFETLIFVYDSDRYGVGSRQGELKSWSCMLPELVDLQALINKTIFCLLPPSNVEGSDLNEWFKSEDYNPRSINDYFRENVKSLSELLFEEYANNLDWHPLILSSLKSAPDPELKEKFFAHVKAKFGGLEDYVLNLLC